MPLIANDLWKGHLLLFEHPSSPDHNAVIGRRLLVGFGSLALLIIPAFQYALRSSGFNSWEWSLLLFASLFLAAFIITMRIYIRVDYTAIGLRKWKDWTAREKIYSLQIILLGSVLFSIIFQQHFQQLIESYGLGKFIIYSALTGLLWGATQEFIYRGLLQTELVRRFGIAAGIVVANIVFTFGPLHIQYFHLGSGAPIQWTMFATIFGIGLFFGILYHRSGNLWIPAIFHGLWPLNMV